MGQHRVRVAAVRDHVGPLLHHHWGYRGHRLDPCHIDLGKLLDERQHGVDLAPQVLDLVIGNRDPRQMRDAANRGGINRHRNLSNGPVARAASSVGV